MSQASSSSYGATDNSGSDTIIMNPIGGGGSASSWLPWILVAVAVAAAAWFLYRKK